MIRKVRSLNSLKKIYPRKSISKVLYITYIILLHYNIIIILYVKYV